MQNDFAALDLADAGFPTYLVEKQEQAGALDGARGNHGEFRPDSQRAAILAASNCALDPPGAIQ